MILTARIRFGDVLKYLDVESIPGCDDDAADWIEFHDCVDVDDDDIPPDHCDICGGKEPEPEPAVDSWLIDDFIAAIKAGHIIRAQALVGRVFVTTDDVAASERALCKCAA